jgi:hypothetical protein
MTCLTLLEGMETVPELALNLLLRLVEIGRNPWKGWRQEGLGGDIGVVGWVEIGRNPWKGWRHLDHLLPNF